MSSNSPWVIPAISTTFLLFLPLLFFLWSRGPPVPLQPALAPPPPSGAAEGEEQQAQREETDGEGSTIEMNGEANHSETKALAAAAPGQATKESGDVATGNHPGSCSISGSICACKHEESQGETASKSEAPGLEGVRVPLQILVGSGTGTAKQLAAQLQNEAFAMNISKFHFDVKVADMADYDYVEQLETETLVVILCSTWTDGTPPQSAAGFYHYLEDASKDFRFGGQALKNVKFSIFGLGSSMYDEESFCKPAFDIENFLLELGATMIQETGTGDDTVDMGPQFESWKSGLWPTLCEEYAKVAGVSAKLEEVAAVAAAAEGASCGSCTTVKSSDQVYKVAHSWEEVDRSAAPSASAAPRRAASKQKKGVVRRFRQSKGGSEREEGGVHPSEDDMEEAVEELTTEDVLNATLVMEEWVSSDEEDEPVGGISTKGGTGSPHVPEGAAGGSGSTTSNSSGAFLMDVEDLGQVVSMSPPPPAASSSSTALTMREKDDSAVAETPAPKEMVTPMQRKKLTKEGYKLIGSHSAVKLCRWTKHQLRGRGGCYKHTFYGITSYQCMEMTPALACANRCVFCWRHGTNPVGREWRWVVDDPHMIVLEGIERHQNMIKEFKGVPGVKLDRWEQAFTVAHCALSLVGEPIMYPHVNELVSELHRRRISTFLVTNAQFPEKIAALSPITQLYVSIDAATKDTLKAIDRPLFKDFWERFLSSLQQIRLKGQRTVYRLTLVKEWNMKEVDGYVELIGIGEPDLIEIKGVTFCGKSPISTLRMDNVPWHHEVRKFAEAIAEQTNGKYEFMAEHAHSCCTLLALSSKFKKNGKWYTWIDYEKYHDLIEKYEKDGTEFDTADYLAETPAWALKGAPEEGFDPVDTRYRKTKGGNVEEMRYKPSDSGCG